MGGGGTPWAGRGSAPPDCWPEDPCGLGGAMGGEVPAGNLGGESRRGNWGGQGVGLHAPKATGWLISGSPNLPVPSSV